MLFTFRDVPVTKCTCLRIPHAERIKGRYYYDIRHDDEGLGNPVTIEKGVLVNHFGTMETLEPIEGINESKFTDDNWEPYFLSKQEQEDIIYHIT